MCVFQVEKDKVPTYFRVSSILPRALWKGALLSLTCFKGKHSEPLRNYLTQGQWFVGGRVRFTSRVFRFSIFFIRWRLKATWKLRSPSFDGDVLPCCRRLRNLHEQHCEAKKAWSVHVLLVERACKLTGWNFYFKFIILHVYFLEIMTINNSSTPFIVCIYIV